MRKLLFISGLFVALAAPAQTTDTSAFTQRSAIKATNIADFAVDNLGNLYLVTTTGLLKKLDEKGDSLNVFNDVRRYGGLSLIDVTNPLKLLLYYKDFSSVIMLDRFLNRVNMIDLRKSGIFQAKAVGLSYDNNIWVYDEQSARLKKVNDEGKMVMETTDLRQVLTVMPSPDKIIDRDGFVYVYDKDNGLYVFDYYGVLKNELPLTGINNLQVVGATVVGISNGNFVRYTLGDLHMREASLPGFIIKSPVKVISSRGIYIYREDQIIQYVYE
ncbi:MAG: hypothetical protein KIT80_02160 [Chitinophagaceae bacterium]|nr:hypothetical protein [Chitinophagaceae bacterium]MCW5925689.1 hypothetical protein [Chitinophagaceae bacterium]